MASLRILITGAGGFLGAYAVAAVRAAGHTALTTSRSAGAAVGVDVVVDLVAPGMVAAVCEALAPDLVLHLAALSRMADCSMDPERAQRANAWLPGEFARRFGARLLHASTDLVFDGRAAPYTELAAVAPLSPYGVSKAAGEERVRAAGGRVVRLPLLFGADAQGRGASASLASSLAAGREVRLFTNEYRSPLHAADAAVALVGLLVEPDGPGLLHLAGPERLSRWQFGQRYCAVRGLSAAALRPVECEDPTRPRDVTLASAYRAPRSLDAMLADC